VGATVVGGAIVALGLVSLSDAGPTDVELVTEPVRLGAASELEDDNDDAEPAATSEEAGTWYALADPVVGTLAPHPFGGSTVIVVRSSSGEALAGALMIQDGYVVTSGVALGGADQVLVTWGDTSEAGTVVGHDDVTDVSVIRVDGPMPDMEGSDTRVRKGDEINLSAEDGSTSLHRVVAAQSTSAMADGKPVVGIVELDGRLGTVPPGTPAFDANGDIVGITTATADSAPAAIVPIDLAREVADEIIATGEATHPWLGVTARDPQDIGAADRAGSLVTAVSAFGPAAAGGMIAGDLITTIDGRSVESMAAMVATLRSYEPGDLVDIVVWRDDREVNCTVELASHLDAEA
jgi:putative serine protease PepD